MKFNYQNYEVYKEFENKEGNQVFLFSDQDGYECAIVVDSDNNVLEEYKTGDCGCKSCREG